MPVKSAACEPRSFQLAGEISDGLLTARAYSPEALRFAADNLLAGAATSGRDPSSLDLADCISAPNCARRRVGPVAARKPPRSTFHPCPPSRSTPWTHPERVSNKQHQLKPVDDRNTPGRQRANDCRHPRSQPSRPERSTRIGTNATAMFPRKLRERAHRRAPALVGPTAALTAWSARPGGSAGRDCRSTAIASLFVVSRRTRGFRHVQEPVDPRRAPLPDAAACRVRSRTIRMGTSRATARRRGRRWLLAGLSAAYRVVDRAAWRRRTPAPWRSAARSRAESAEGVCVRGAARLKSPAQAWTRARSCRAGATSRTSAARTRHVDQEHPAGTRRVRHPAAATSRPRTCAWSSPDSSMKRAGPTSRNCAGWPSRWATSSSSTHRQTSACLRCIATPTRCCARHSMRTGASCRSRAWRSASRSSRSIAAGCEQTVRHGE